VSILIRFPPSNMSKDQYESIRTELEGAGEWPADGCQLHVCFGPDDDMRVSEIWESPEQAQAFGERLRPRIEQAGVQMSSEPEMFEIHRFDRF
jgi:hypothetical protein